MENDEQTAFLKAWEEWLATKEGQECLAGNPSGAFLKNRLWYAFSAAWSARSPGDRE